MLFEQIPAYLEFFGFGTTTPEELRSVAKIKYLTSLPFGRSKWRTKTSSPNGCETGIYGSDLIRSFSSTRQRFT